MRRSLILLAFGLVSCFALAQAPQAISYQAAARDLAGNAIADQLVSVRFRVHQSTANGTVVYGETHTTTTSPHGLFTLSLGLGAPESGTFSSINWASGPYFLEVALDTVGGSNYVLIGSQQLLSVPYALHAGGVACPTVSLLGDTLKQANGCFVIIPGISAANGGCVDLDSDGFYDQSICNTPEDCDDSNAQTHPGAQEVCDGIDNDCDGQVDEGGVCDCPDNDADGFTTCAGDCDDDNASTNPDAAEVCDGVDNNCDGQIDEGCAECTPGQVEACGSGIGACTQGSRTCTVMRARRHA